MTLRWWAKCRDFYLSGRNFFEDKRYREALEYFTQALGALDNVDQSSSLWQILDMRSFILRTHISLADYSVGDAFIHGAYDITTLCRRKFHLAYYMMQTIKSLENYWRDF